jgi:hypothetical protein
MKSGRRDPEYARWNSPREMEKSDREDRASKEAFCTWAEPSEMPPMSHTRSSSSV